MTVTLNDYARSILDLYARLPGTPTRIRPADRRLIRELHSRGIALQTVQAALLLACARRVCRDPSKPPLAQVRSLAYFMPVIEELNEAPLPTGYLDYIRSKIPFKTIP